MTHFSTLGAPSGSPHAQPRAGGALPLAALLAVLLAMAAAGVAQGALIDTYFPPGTIGYDTAPGVTVATRLRPDFDAPGFTVGSFTIRPTIAPAAGITSNAAFRAGGTGSALFHTTGSLLATSNWGSDNVSAYLGFDDTRTPSVASQNNTGWSASIGKQFDFGRDRLSLAASHLNLYQTSRDLNTPVLLDKPGLYQVNNIRAGYHVDLGAFSVEPALEFTSFVYNNVTAGGASLNQTFRNRNVIDGSVTTRYAFDELSSALLVLRGTSIDYTDTSAGVASRDSNTVTVLAGIDHAPGGKWRYRALVGVQTRQFNNAAYKSVTTPAAEAAVTYLPTGLTSITVGIGRTIEDAAAENAGAYVLTEGKLSIDHELTRSVLLNAYVAVGNADYQPGGTETDTRFGAGATWLLNRNMRVAGNYDHISRKPISGASVSEDMMLMRLQLGL